MSIFSTRPDPEPRGPGQESAWEYPRPPALKPTSRRLRVVFDGAVIAETTRGLRTLETSHPPTYYFPLDDIEEGVLERSDRTTFCEFKGRAFYCAVRHGDRYEPEGAWGYDRVTPSFEAMVDHIGFYAGRMDACYVDDELAIAQPGDFYGGWITEDVVGPFKGGPGTRGW